MRIAIVGCGHGELNKIYQAVSPSTELLIICGDFQALRNSDDLDTIAVPMKYRALGDFYQYYNGQKKAPVPTLFIGGNHECSSYLQELRFGGYVAPNIYYMGEAGCVWFGGLRIGGISGIWNPRLFETSIVRAEEKLPYNDSSLRTVYHIKAQAYLKAWLATTSAQEPPMDVYLSHDWPQNIAHYGNLRQLLQRKPFFRDDISSGKLGSPAALWLMFRLQPRYWFSGHLHVRFEATVVHGGKKRKAGLETQNSKVAKNLNEIALDMDDEPPKNQDEITLDMDDEPPKNQDQIPLDMDDTTKVPVARKPKQTYFLALDKCGRNRKYIEHIDIPVESRHPSSRVGGFHYDRRAIAVNKVVESFTTSKVWPTLTDLEFLDLEKTGFASELLELVFQEEQKLKSVLDSDLEIPSSFVVTAPVEEKKEGVLRSYVNPQTTSYVERFFKK